MYLRWRAGAEHSRAITVPGCRTEALRSCSPHHNNKFFASPFISGTDSYWKNACYSGQASRVEATIKKTDIKNIAGAPPSFHLQVRPAGSSCNLACKYCYAIIEESRDRLMDDEVLDQYISQFLNAQQVPYATIAWQGGEPTLMGMDFFQRSVELAARYRPPGMEVRYTIQTNGVDLDEDWCSFFKENNFLVGISIDGPAKFHDAYRKDKSGKPVFDKVMTGLGRLQEHGVNLNILTTVNAANAKHPLEVYRFLRDEAGARFIQFSPVVIRIGSGSPRKKPQVSKQSVHPEKYGDFLCSIFDEWVREDVGDVFVQLFDTALSSWAGAPAGICSFSKTCGASLALEPDGSVYSCEYFIKQGYRLGNIRDKPLAELAGSLQQTRFGRVKFDNLPHYCHICSFNFACNGGCPKNRFIKSPTQEKGLNYLCAGYKKFFNHIDKPMRAMADLLRRNKAPSEIMGNGNQEE